MLLGRQGHSREAVLVVVIASLGQAKVLSRNLAAGSVTVRGDHAVVVLTGTVCRSHYCVTNASPSTTNPIFTVPESLEGGRWLVTFNGGASNSSTTSRPSVSSGSAPARP